MNDEFIYITPLSVFGTVFVGTWALVSNRIKCVYNYGRVVLARRRQPGDPESVEEC